MRPSIRLRLAAALLAGAATPALAQTGYGSQSGYGREAYGAPSSGYGSQPYPPSTYDRSSSGYPPSGGRPSPYDDTRRPGDPGGADRYDQGQGSDQAEDPEALARQLNLTPSQRASFDAYRRAFTPDEARSRQEDDDMRRMATMSTPQRLDSARAALARDRADFDRTDAATRSFYAQLSPAQRRTFDQLTAPPPEDEGSDQGGPSATQPTARPPR